MNRETRLAGYKSNIGRFMGEMKDRYDYSDPLQIGAAGVNAATQFLGIDPLTRDIGRAFDKNKMPISPYEGFFPRTREDTVGALHDLFNGRIGSAIIKPLNLIGDAAADTADTLSGVR